MRHSLVSRATGGLLAALLFSSCFSVQTRHHPLADPRSTTGGVALRVFADDASRRALAPGPRGLFVELERREGRGGYAPVFRSLEPAWSVMGLPAGEYRLRFPARLDENGDAVTLDEKPRRVRVRSGEVTEVDAVLEHVNRGLIAAGVITAVVAAVLLDDWLDDHDLPLPPLPPPPPEVIEAIFYVTLDAATSPVEPWQAAGPVSTPVVTSHFPPADARVAARRVRVTFALSAPLDARTVRADGVTVLAEEHGVVPGNTTYDPDRWWIVWESDEDLPRDDTLHVTLADDAVEDLRGDDLPASVSFVFRTTP